MTSSTDSHYDVLGVDPDASNAEIKQAYREKVKEHHPDHSDDPNAQEKLIRVREAKETLLNPKDRRRYDRKRNTNTSEATNAETVHEQRHKRGRQRRQRRQRQHRKREDSRSQTRAGRQTETRTRERDRTASRDRESHTDRSVWERLRGVVTRLRTVRRFPKRWHQKHFHSPQATRDLLGSLVTGPTVIRLTATVALALSVTEAVAMLGVSAGSPAVDYGILIACLGVSYLCYAFVTPLPFETPRTRERFKPADRTTLWPLVCVHLFGVGVFALTDLLGTEPGVVYAGSAVVYVLLVTIGCSICFGPIAAIIVGSIHDNHPRVREWLSSRGWSGFLLGSCFGVAVAAVVLFTSFSGNLSLRARATESMGSVGPWVPAVTAGPVHLGSALNFVIGAIAFGSVIGGVIGMLWALTSVPWRDRFDHGYSIRPTGWNLLVAVPVVSFVWMFYSGVSSVPLSIATHTLRIHIGLITAWLVLLPSVLVGAYLLRRYLEPTLQRYR